MMSSGKQNMYVVVWEWENKQGRWRPYPPEVTQQLERAHSKGLTKVLLGDSDPSLRDYIIMLAEMQQRSVSTGETGKVQRKLYLQSSPAGQGAVWQWQSNTRKEWHVYDMCIQCIIETSWTSGAQIVDLSQTFPLCPYVINFCGLTQTNKRTNFSRTIRRIQQASYPVTKPPDSDGNQAGTSSSRHPRRASRDYDMNPTSSYETKPRNILHKLLAKFTKDEANPPNEMCSICMESLQDNSDYSEGPTMYDQGLTGVVNLVLCGHLFHLACLSQMVSSASASFLQCPNCKTLHGEKQGNQPKGNMEFTVIKGSLPGYQGHNTIQIIYDLKSGLQGPDHPNPGKPYHCIGFPRVAYLPECDKGKKVLNLLREAWKRRLIFTIGTSVTTGTQDAVTWNEIHHKTEKTNANGHGYPDPGYLDNVLAELASQGVTETTLV